MKSLLLILASLLLSACSTTPTSKKGYDAELTSFTYPFEVKSFLFVSQTQNLKMTYMDVSPVKPAQKTIVLLHGKNFSGYYFKEVIEMLNSKGYRVIVPDQIGFGKSTKPKSYQYSFQTLADNTHQLLQSLGITNYQILGHSMGGMIATRYALMFPKEVSRLILVNPIGLEDWKTMTSYRNLDAGYKSELSNSADKIRDYQKQYYYDGKWSEPYEALIQTHLGWLEGSDKEVVAWNAALTSDMIFTQPVYYEFKNLKMPVVLINGSRDTTAIGKAWAEEPMKSKMGNYPKMGKDVVRMIPKGKLIELKGLGHMPFIEAPERFWKETATVW